MGNNPIAYNDPSGHIPECGPDGIYCNPSISAEDKYNITFSGTWTDEHKETALEAVELVARRFASAMGGNSGMAWSFIYGYMNFMWGSSNATGGCADVTSGGCTSNSHQINFWSMSGDPNESFRMVKNVVHEMGHTYDWTTYDSVTKKRASNYMPSSIYDNRNLFLRPNEWTDPTTGKSYPSTFRYDWQQHPNEPGDTEAIRQGETFADMFIAWTYSAWNTSTDPRNVAAVENAQSWMRSWMP